MDQHALLDPDRLSQFVGGEIEIQNGAENYTYRGQIATIAVVDEILTVTMRWFARAVDTDGNRSRFPTGDWAEEEDPSYRLTVIFPPSPQIQGGQALELVTVTEIGEGRFFISSAFYNEVITLFPQGGSQLPHDKVRWLPDGPKARSDAAAGK